MNYLFIYSEFSDLCVDDYWNAYWFNSNNNGYNEKMANGQIQFDFCYKYFMIWNYIG